MKLKILLISSNPTRDLSLDDEYRTIERAIKIGKYRNSIELVPKLASRIEDLIQALNEERPHIIHFTGHGNTMGELMFTNDTGYHAIPINALKKLFEATSDNIRLIFLDACYSKRQAEVINSEIDYVIGMNTSIGEDTATTFAEIFYNSFTSGRTIIEAFNQAKVMLEINHPKELNTPELLIKNEEIKDIKLHDIISLEENISKKKDEKVPEIVQNHTGEGDNVVNKKVINKSVSVGGSNSGIIITGDDNTVS